MAKHGKKFRAAAEKVDRNKRYTVAEGFKLLRRPSRRARRSSTRPSTSP